MNTYDTINDVLVYLFNEIWKVEKQAIITEEFSDITNNDMHVLEAVGLSGSNMSSIAKKLDITVGSLTTAMNSLVKKQYVDRKRSEKDRRVVNIYLTARGEEAYRHHKEFHAQMTDAIIGQLSKEEAQILSKALKNLSEFFRTYGKEKE